MTQVKTCAAQRSVSLHDLRVSFAVDIFIRRNYYGRKQGNNLPRLWNSNSIPSPHSKPLSNFDYKNLAWSLLRASFYYGEKQLTSYFFCDSVLLLFRRSERGPRQNMLLLKATFLSNPIPHFKQAYSFSKIYLICKNFLSKLYRTKWKITVM